MKLLEGIIVPIMPTPSTLIGKAPPQVEYSIGSKNQSASVILLAFNVAYALIELIAFTFTVFSFLAIQFWWSRPVPSVP